MCSEKNSNAGKMNATAYSCKFMLWNSRSRHVLYFETQIAITIPEANTGINYNCKESNIIADKTWRNCTCKRINTMNIECKIQRSKSRNRNNIVQIKLLYMSNNFNKMSNLQMHSLCNYCCLAMNNLLIKSKCIHKNMHNGILAPSHTIFRVR